jgi:hypothetical protein
MLAHQQIVNLLDVRLITFIRPQLAYGNAVHYLSALAVFFIGKTVIVKEQPTIGLHQFVDEKKCQAVHGPVLGAVDETEIVAWLALPCGRLAGNFLFQEPCVGVHLPVNCHPMTETSLRQEGLQIRLSLCCTQQIDRIQMPTEIIKRGGNIGARHAMRVAKLEA